MARTRALPAGDCPVQNWTMTTPSLPDASAAFCLLRHGQSEANVRKLIASSPAAAFEAFGLTDTGRTQVRESVIAALAAGVIPPTCQVISSPLLRARESAAIAAEVLGTTVRVDPRLAERGFGEFELQSDEHYDRVWNEDRADPSHRTWGVESTTGILERVSTLLRELEESGGSSTFLLCTHGDVASVMLCAASGRALAEHRDVGAMANGEVRPLARPDQKGLSGFRRE
jgi:broad specificity phosphatase PhoE